MELPTGFANNNLSESTCNVNHETIIRTVITLAKFFFKKSIEFSVYLKQSATRCKPYTEIFEIYNVLPTC